MENGVRKNKQMKKKDEVKTRHIILLSLDMRLMTLLRQLKRTFGRRKHPLLREIIIRSKRHENIDESPL